MSNTNAVPIWVQNGPTVDDLANNIQNLSALRQKVDDVTQRLIDILISDLKTYLKNGKISAPIVPGAVSDGKCEESSARQKRVLGQC